MSEAASMSFDTTVTTRGYTNHEQIDPVGLIHMNGRVYDAELGRFISADPLVQDTTNLQSFNRFAYVFNNPLSHTDPSGFAGFGISRSTAQQFYYSYYAASLIYKKNLNTSGRLAKSTAGSPIMAPHTTPQSSQASSFGGTLYQAASTQAEPFVQMATYTFGSFGTTLNDVAEDANALSYGGSFQEGFSPGAHQDKASREAKTVTSREKDNFVRLVGYAGSPYDTAGWSTKQKQDAAVEASLIIAGMAGIVVAPIAAEATGALLVKGATKLFSSKTFGYNSKMLGNKNIGQIGQQGTLNVSGRWFKLGWSNTPNYGGGIAIRLGLGRNPVNPNKSRFHIGLPGTFVPNRIYQPLVRAKK